MSKIYTHPAFFHKIVCLSADYIIECPVYFIVISLNDIKFIKNYITLKLNRTLPTCFAVGPRWSIIYHRCIMPVRQCLLLIPMQRDTTATKRAELCIVICDALQSANRVSQRFPFVISPGAFLLYLVTHFLKVIL